MSPTDVDDIFQRYGSTPLRLTLSSGDQLIVERPDLVFFDGLTLLYGTGYKPESRVSQRMKWVSIPNIALIEPVQHRNGGRRRRK